MVGRGEDAARVGELQLLLRTFKPERIVNVTMALASFVLQVVLFLLFYRAGAVGWKEFAILAGPGGLLLATMGRVLRMWTDCVHVLQPAGETGGEDER